MIRFSFRAALALALGFTLTAGCGLAPLAPTQSVGTSFEATRGITSKDGLYRLVVQPEAGEDPVLSLIGGAKRSLDICIYLISNQNVIGALSAAAQRGVRVRVMMEINPFNPERPREPLKTNREAAKVLIPSGVQVAWTDPAFSYTHAKFIVADRQRAFITSSNMTNSGLNKNRDIGVMVSDPKALGELLSVFDGDWNHRQHRPKYKHLVFSPDNSRERLIGMISGAKKQIRLESEVFTDPGAMEALAMKVRQGLDVQVMLADPGRIPTNAQTAAELLKLGVKVKYLIEPFLHAKAMSVDGKKAYVGSINFSTGSIDRNREVGVLLDDPAILAAIGQLWDRDWSAGVDAGSYTPPAQP